MSSAGVFPSPKFSSRREERHRGRPVRAGRQRGTGGWSAGKLAQHSLEAEDMESYRYRRIYCCLKAILVENRFNFHLTSAPKSVGKDKQPRKCSAIV